MDDLFLPSSDSILNYDDPLKRFETRLKEQYMHFFLQPLDIVLTAWRSEDKFKKLEKANKNIEKAVEDLVYTYNEMHKELCTWLSKHKLSIGVDQNKTVDWKDITKALTSILSLFIKL